MLLLFCHLGEKRLRCRLDSFLFHCTFETIFRNTLWRPHSCSNDSEVVAQFHDFKVFVDFVLLLSALSPIRMEAMIFPLSRGRCTPSAPESTRLQNEAVNSDIPATTGFLSGLQFSVETSSSTISSSQRWQLVHNDLRLGYSTKS